MIRRFPDYYDEFKCIADKCEATCCAGWQIVIDEVSLERYKEQQLNKYVDFNEECFYWQDAASKECSFLRKDKLCQMVIDMGEDNLCDTCRLYPRHIEEFRNVREFSLGISCPEVARKILSKKEKVTYSEIEDRSFDNEEYDDYEQEVYLKLKLLRDEIFILLSNYELSYEKRCEKLLNMVAKFQDTMDFDDEEALLYEYRELRIPYMSIFDTQKQWEVMDDNWAIYVEKCRDILFSKNSDESVYLEILNDFNRQVQFDKYMEKLTEYFLYTYFCGSAYDEYYYGQAQLGVVFAMQIRDLVMATWMMNDKNISFDEIVRITYSYARQLEHSNSNVMLMEKLMDEIRII